VFFSARLVPTFHSRYIPCYANADIFSIYFEFIFLLHLCGAYLGKSQPLKVREKYRIR